MRGIGTRMPIAHLMASRRRTWLPLLLVLVLVIWFARIASAKHAKHVSPAKLYGHGGRGVMASETLNYDGVISCLFEVADRSYDARLNHIELEQVLARYTTPYEQLTSGLSAAQFAAQCDSVERDGVLSRDELSSERHCLRTAQLEALTRYVCDRAKHRDYVYAQYQQTYDQLRAAIAQNGAKGLLEQGMHTLREMAAPHAGRHARIEVPDEQTNDLIGARLEPEIILAGLFVVFIVLVVAAVATVTG
jgi:hypothetical protein